MIIQTVNAPQFLMQYTCKRVTNIFPCIFHGFKYFNSAYLQ